MVDNTLWPNHWKLDTTCGIKAIKKDFFSRRQKQIHTENTPCFLASFTGQTLRALTSFSGKASFKLNFIWQQRNFSRSVSGCCTQILSEHHLVYKVFSLLSLMIDRKNESRYILKTPTVQIFIVFDFCLRLLWER